MGNNQSSGERRSKPGDPYGHMHSRMDGTVFQIDKQRPPKTLVSQFSEEEPAPVLGTILKSSDGKENVDPAPLCPIPLLNEPTEKRLPIVIKWTGAGKDVKVAGDFNGWTSIPMVKSEKDFVCIVDLPEGSHEYKFLVDGEWKVNPSENFCTNDLGTENNVILVKDSDFEELENALLRDPNDKKQSPYATPNLGHYKVEGVFDADEYGQIIPEASPTEPQRRPPGLPPHLLQVILNKDTPVSCEPTLLPEPNHVMLNHMYALSIRDGTMVLSTSHRFRKKCVTTLIYRPI